MNNKDIFGLLGTTIDQKYRIESVVGEGGFGVVYKGFHLGFGESVAVKCLKLPATLEGEARESFHKSFLDEGRLLHRLSRATAGIVQALDVGITTSPTGAWVPYLVLEWLRGAPLEDEMNARAKAGKGGLPLAEAIALLEPAARALGVAHDQGVAHRDVKPANLFISEVAGKKTLKVLDFGVAKVLLESTGRTRALVETGTSIKAFTPQYGAPEQFNRNMGATGPWTDVFALALVLVELVSGRAALDGQDTTQLYIASIDESHRPTLRLRGVKASDEVEAVLRHALAVEAKFRYATASEFWDALVAAAGVVHESGASVPSASELPTTPARGTPSLQKAEPREVLPTGEWLTNLQGSPAEDTKRDTSPRAFTAPADSEPSQTNPSHSVATTMRAQVVPSAPPTPPRTDGARPSRARQGAIGVAVVMAFAGAGAWALTRDDKTTAASVAPAASDAAAAISAPPGMALVPAGTFTMGTEQGGKTERPAHKVTLTHGFAIDLTEVTAGDYAACVHAGKCVAAGVHGCGLDDGDMKKLGALCTGGDPTKARHPITCVDALQATAYCDFAGKRLPTEAEWEYAARGTDERAYPWGNEAPMCDRGVFFGVFEHTGTDGCPGRPKGTMAVGSFPLMKSPFGAVDMAGNTWEWVADGWDANAYSGGAMTDPMVKRSGDRGVLRGGSWDFAPTTAKATFRLSFELHCGSVSTGFRCAKTIEESK